MEAQGSCRMSTWLRWARSADSHLEFMSTYDASCLLLLHHELMRFARVLMDNRARWVRAETGDMVTCLSDVPWQFGSQLTDQTVPLDAVRLLAPAEPSKIVAVGRNYAEHARELGLERTATPRIFLKPPSGVVGPGAAIVYPRISQEVHYEAELAVVIGSRCRDLPPENATAAIFGYTCANDVTARDIQRRDGQPSFAKSFDTFCPLGPWLETELDSAVLAIRCSVNGEQRQDGHTSDMLWAVPDLLAYISSAMTLFPGDVVLTGTPAGVGPLLPGDEVAVSIAGIGELSNPVVADDSARLE